MYSHRSGADNPRGQNFDVNRNLLSLRSFATSLKKKLCMILYNFFMILYLYIAPGQGLTTPLGQNFDVNKNLLSLQSYVASFKKSPWRLILYNKCSLAGADSPQGTKFWCQQICLVTSFICCKFKKKSLWSLMLYIFFFHDLIHVVPAQEQRGPRGLNFGANRKALSLFPFVASFKEISLKSDFIQLFSWLNTCI